jgi:hypothetical protein
VGPSELNQLPRGPFGIVLHRSGLIGALVGHPPRIRPAGCPVRCRFGALTQPVIMGGAQSSRGAAGYLAAAATALRYTAASLWERSGCRSVRRAHSGVRVSSGSIAPPAQSPSRVAGWLPHSDQRRPEAPPPVGYVPQ